MADDRTYVRVHDGMPDHPKIIAAGGDAGWLWQCGMCYCGRQLTNGRIPKAVVPRLSDRRQPMRLATRLVQVGLWEDCGDHFLMHDFLEHNRSAEEVAALKAKRREAGSRGGKAKASATANGKQVLQQEPEQMPSSVPSNSVPEVETEVDTYSHPQTTDSGWPPSTDDDDEQQQPPKASRNARLRRAEQACDLIADQAHAAAVAAGNVHTSEPAHLAACIRSARTDHLAEAQLAVFQQPHLTAAEIAAQLTAVSSNGHRDPGEPQPGPVYERTEDDRQAWEDEQARINPPAVDPRAALERARAEAQERKAIEAEALKAKR